MNNCDRDTYGSPEQPTYISLVRVQETRDARVMIQPFSGKWRDTRDSFCDSTKPKGSFYFPFLAFLNFQFLPSTELATNGLISQQLQYISLPDQLPNW